MTDVAFRIEMGKRIKEARESAGFKSAVDASKATGIHVQSVRDHESGRRGADIEHLETYARKYNVNFVWLATGRGVMREDADTVDFWVRRLSQEEYDEVRDFARFKYNSQKK